MASPLLYGPNEAEPWLLVAGSGEVALTSSSCWESTQSGLNSGLGMATMCPALGAPVTFWQGLCRLVGSPSHRSAWCGAGVLVSDVS